MISRLNPKKHETEQEGKGHFSWLVKESQAKFEVEVERASPMNVETTFNFRAFQAGPKLHLTVLFLLYVF